MANQIVSAAVDRYLQNLQDEIRRSAGDARLRSPKPAIDIDGFFSLVGDTISTQQDLEGVQNKIQYMEDFPEEEDNIEKREVITYSILERKPGTFEQKGAGAGMKAGNVRARRPIYQEMTIDPEAPGSKIFSYSQIFDNTICFKLWARTNKIANKRAMWFEDFMDTWRWYFRANGIIDVYYQGRGEDIHKAPNNRKVVCRPLYYYVRTEKVTQVREFVLRELILRGSKQEQDS